MFALSHTRRSTLNDYMVNVICKPIAFLKLIIMNMTLYIVCIFSVYSIDCISSNGIYALRNINHMIFKLLLLHTRLLTIYVETSKINGKTEHASEQLWGSTTQTTGQIIHFLQIRLFDSSGFLHIRPALHNHHAYAEVTPRVQERKPEVTHTRAHNRNPSLLTFVQLINPCPRTRN